MELFMEPLFPSFKLFLRFFSTLLFFFFINHSFAQEKSSTCGEIYKNAYNDCQRINYSNLPPQVKQLMKKNHCNIEKGQTYDYGYRLNLNDDDTPEYIFCCEESSHGPCIASVYAKIKNKWTVIFKTDGYENDNCEIVLPVLKSIHSGFHDLCVDDKIVIFENGKYLEQK
jgi:hypothetical protein